MLGPPAPQKSLQGGLDQLLRLSCQSLQQPPDPLGAGLGAISTLLVDRYGCGLLPQPKSEVVHQNQEIFFCELARHRRRHRLWLRRLHAVALFPRRIGGSMPVWEKSCCSSRVAGSSRVAMKFHQGRPVVSDRACRSRCIPPQSRCSGAQPRCRPSGVGPHACRPPRQRPCLSYSTQSLAEHSPRTGLHIACDFFPTRESDRQPGALFSEIASLTATQESLFPEL